MSFYLLPSMGRQSWWALLSRLVKWKDGSRLTFELMSDAVVSLPPLSTSRMHFAVSVNFKPGTDRIMDMWNRKLKGRAGSVFTSQCVWVYGAYVKKTRERDLCRGIPLRSRVMTQSSACIFRYSDPPPHTQLSYRPPSRPDTNRKSDLHTETPNYISVDRETMKRLESSIVSALRAGQAESPM